MESPLTFKNFYNHPRFWRHAIPWLAVLGFLYLSIYSLKMSEGSMETMDISDTFFLAVAEILTIIYGSFFIYNRLYKKKKKLGLTLILIAILIVIVSLVDHHTNTTVIQLGEIEGFWADITIFPIIVLVAFGLKMAYHGSRQLFVIERLQAQQTESELKLLKSQVNPHFLFNTLNNIYSTNLEDQEKANEIILELSDVLRYQLESYKSKLTPLSDEIHNIESYIHLEKIRVLDCEVSVSKEGDFNSVKIIPLLLLPFIENAFKYGTGIEKGKIDISFKLSKDKEFYFESKNKIVQKRGKVHSGGIGLENVKKRLHLMYPQQHDLTIESDDSEFYVHLKIRL